MALALEGRTVVHPACGGAGLQSPVALRMFPRLCEGMPLRICLD